MKARAHVFPALLAVVAMAGCGAIGQFDTTIQADGAIPGGLSQAGAFAAGSFDASGSLQQSFDSKGVSVSHISSAKVTAGTLTVTDTSQTQNNLAYIKSFEIDVSAPGQQTVAVAHIDPSVLTNRPTSVPFVVSDVELKPYLASGSVTMTPNVMFNSRPASPVPIHLAVTVHIVPQL